MIKTGLGLLKKLLLSWLPPLIWMAFIFPGANWALGNSITYRVIVAVFKWLLPAANPSTIDILYIIVRKSFHFVEYAILALLLFRAFRKMSSKIWDFKWAIFAGGIAIGYGFLDELVQTFIPSRMGSLLDWLIDSGGVIFALGMICLRNRKINRTIPNESSVKHDHKESFLIRFFDFSLSLVGIIVSLPLWFFIGLLILLEDGWPIFYLQERVGKKGRVFKAIKFRSMIKDAEKSTGPVQASENDPRTTKVGRILRATAMDELPQLVNILKGEMSFVGPRAIRPEELEVNGNPSVTRLEDIAGYNERQSIRPGLTGLTQIYLPKDIPLKEKFDHDLIYIKKQSLGYNLKLIFLSFWITFRGKWESRQNKI